MSEFVLRIVLVGAGATLVMDLWAVLLRQVYGVAGPDYRMVGRWVGQIPAGRFRHDAIGRAAPVAGEAVIGWVVHYATGICFAAGLVAVWGTDWLLSPSVMPALVTGLVTVAAPYLVMQPAFGLGIAASRAPNPTAARLRSLVTHLVFGTGLYAAASLASAL